MQRDREVNFLLKETGYKVFRFWEWEIKKDLASCLGIVLNHLDLNKRI